MRTIPSMTEMGSLLFPQILHGLLSSSINISPPRFVDLYVADSPLRANTMWRVRFSFQSLTRIYIKIIFI